MGDPDEEQELELEALAAIFLEDYELLSEGKPREVKVRLVPVPGEDAGEENKVGVWMTFKLPESYPEVEPEMEVQPLMGLTEGHCKMLLEKAKEEAGNNVGIPMIFTITEVVKDWLTENNQDQTDDSMHARMMRKEQDAIRAKEKEEERQARKYEVDGEDAGQESEDDGPRPVTGTIVNAETFKAWLEKFAQEKRDAAGVDVKVQDPNAMNGREFFQSKAAASAASGVDKDEEAEEWDTEIQEDLFLEDDEDLDDLDDLDDDEDESEDDD